MLFQLFVTTCKFWLDSQEFIGIQNYSDICNLFLHFLDEFLQHSLEYCSISAFRLCEREILPSSGWLMYTDILQVVESRVQLLKKLEDLDLSSKSDLISLVESLVVSALRFFSFLMFFVFLWQFSLSPTFIRMWLGGIGMSFSFQICT